jgi:hypothetical protein
MKAETDAFDIMPRTGTGTPCCSGPSNALETRKTPVCWFGPETVTPEGRSTHEMVCLEFGSGVKMFVHIVFTGQLDNT